MRLLPLFLLLLLFDSCRRRTLLLFLFLLLPLLLPPPLVRLSSSSSSLSALLRLAPLTFLHLQLAFPFPVARLLGTLFRCSRSRHCPPFFLSAGLGISLSLQSYCGIFV